MDVSTVPPVYEGNEFQPHDAPRLSCDPERGYLYLTYTLAHTVVLYDAYEYTPYFTRSLDQGQTWSTPIPLGGSAGNGARAAVGPDGEVYVVWEDYAAQAMMGRKSTDFGASFGPAFEIAPVLDNLGTNAPGWLGGADRSNPVYPGYSGPPDFPAVAVDRSAGPRRGRVYVAWTDYATGTVGPFLGIAPEGEPNNFWATASLIEIGQDIVHHVPNGHTGETDCDVFTLEATQGTTLWGASEVESIYPYPDYPYFVGVPLYCGPDSAHLVGLSAISGKLGAATPPLIYTLPMTGRYWITARCAAAEDVWEIHHLRTFTFSPGQAARDHRDVVLVSSGDGGQTWSPKVPSTTIRRGWRTRCPTWRWTRSGRCT